jgi:phosphoglycerate dehydrogenase-like enzyme
MVEALLVTETFLERHGEELDTVAPEAPRAVVGPKGLEQGHEQVRIAFFSGDCFESGLAREFMIAALKSTSLEWLHTASAGVDHEVFHRFLERGVRLTTSSGAHAVPIAQTVLLYLLALSRDLPGWLAAQHAHRWEPRSIHDLQGDRVAVVGLGPIGLEIARLASALHMDVVGLRRRPRGDEPCPTLTLDRLSEVLPSVDWLVLALPLTTETRHTLDADAIALLPPRARVINIGRGALIDEAALVAALRSGGLAGAGLDVFEVEPLPSESPLWDLPNVILTPHSSGTNPGNNERAAAMFFENLRRFRAGEPLRNEVVV